MDAKDCTKLEGRCLCGAIRVSIAQSRPGIDVCHCAMCRRWTGGPFFSLRGVSRDAIDLAGEDRIAVFRSSDWAERASCSACGSALWYRFLPADTHALAAGLFDPPDYSIREQIFVDERPDWARLAAQTVEKTGAEVMAEAATGGFDIG